MANNKDDRTQSDVGNFFSRLKGQDRIRKSDSLIVLNSPQTDRERQVKQKITSIVQYVKNKTWSRRHIEFFEEYRRMCATFPIIKAGIDIYGESIVNKNSDGQIFTIKCENKHVKELLEECFFKNLALNAKGYKVARMMCQFGNAFGYLITRPKDGVTDIVFLPPEAIIREQMYDPSNLENYRFTWYGAGGGALFEPWEIVHWKNGEDIEMEPYGTSILRPIVDTWRRVVLIREALVIYRITRAPSKLLFKIATDGLSGEEAYQFAQNMKKEIQKKPLTNPQTGELDFKYSPISIEENLFMPTYEGSPSDVQVLEGASNLDAVEDYKIIKDDIYAGLKIPKSFLTMEEDLSNKAALCIARDVSVTLLDGRNLKVEEISEEIKTNPDLWVYSYNKEKNCIEPAQIKWCKKTKENTELIRVWLDNGEYVDCTPDHRFILRGGEECQAQNLKDGDSLQGALTMEYKVVKVEFLKEKKDCYDLEVLSNNHNFLTKAGVFVHNSEESVNFAVTIQRLQSEFVEGLLHIGTVHLFLKGCSQEEMQSFTIEMNNPSVASEKKKLELVQARIDIAKSAWDYNNPGLNLMSYVDVLKSILKFSDAEIEATIKSQFNEKKISWRLEQLRANGFYDEPDLEKRIADMRGLTGDPDGKVPDSFKGITFEGDTLTEVMKKKIDQEIREIVGPPASGSPSEKMIRQLTEGSDIINNIRKSKRDFGM